MVPAKSKFKDTVKDKLGKVDYSVSCSTSAGAHLCQALCWELGTELRKISLALRGLSLVIVLDNFFLYLISLP